MMNALSPLRHECVLNIAQYIVFGQDYSKWAKCVKPEGPAKWTEEALPSVERSRGGVQQQPDPLPKQHLNRQATQHEFSPFSEHRRLMRLQAFPAEVRAIGAVQVRDVQVVAFDVQLGVNP